MAGAYWSIRPPGVEAAPSEVVVEPAPSFAELRARQRLARVVEAKLAEGFEVESGRKRRYCWSSTPGAGWG